MKAIVLAYVIQAGQMAMLISSKLHGREVLPSGARQASHFLEEVEAGGISFFMMCLFGYLGIIRSIVEFGDGGNKRLGTVGLLTGIALIAGMMYVRVM